MVQPWSFYNPDPSDTNPEARRSGQLNNPGGRSWSDAGGAAAPWNPDQRVWLIPHLHENEELDDNYQPQLVARESHIGTWSPQVWETIPLEPEPDLPLDADFRDAGHVLASYSVLYPGENNPPTNGFLNQALDEITELQNSEIVAINNTARSVLLHFRIDEHEDTGILTPAHMNWAGRNLMNPDFWERNEYDIEIPQNRLIFLMRDMMNLASSQLVDQPHYTVIPALTVHENYVDLTRAYPDPLVDNMAENVQRFLTYIRNEDLWRKMNKLPAAVNLGRFLRSWIKGLVIFKNVYHQ